MELFFIGGGDCCLLLRMFSTKKFFGIEVDIISVNRGSNLSSITDSFAIGTTYLGSIPLIW